MKLRDKWSYAHEKHKTISVHDAIQGQIVSYDSGVAESARSTAENAASMIASIVDLLADKEVITKDELVELLHRRYEVVED